MIKTFGCIYISSFKAFKTSFTVIKLMHDVSSAIDIYPADNSHFEHQKEKERHMDCNKGNLFLFES